MYKSISDLKKDQRGPQWVPLLSAKNRKLVHQKWAVGDWKILTKSDEPGFLLQ